MALLSALVVGLWVAPAAASENGASEPPRTIESYAILATDVLWLGRGTSVEAGHVGVNLARKPFFARHRPIEAWIGRGVRLGDDSALVADSIWFGRDVSVAQLFANETRGRDPGVAPVSVTLPILALPEAPSPALGVEDVRVRAGESIRLEPGEYRNLVVESEAVVRLSPGAYTFGRWLILPGAEVVAQGAVEVQIAGNLVAGQRTRIGTVEGVAAADFRIWVLGPLASVSSMSAVEAVVQAPDSFLLVGRGSTVTGGLIGQRIFVGQNVTVVGARQPPDRISPSVDLEFPGPGDTVFATETFVATAADDGGVESVEFLVDGSVVGAVGSPEDDGTYTVGFDTTLLADGEHVARVRAIDTSGNVAETADTAFSVANFMGSVERLVTDRQRGLLSADDFAVRGLQSVLSAVSLPDRYVAPSQTPTGDAPDGDGPIDGTMLAFSFLEEWDQLSPEVQVSIASMGEVVGPVDGEFLPSNPELLAPGGAQGLAPQAAAADCLGKNRAYKRQDSGVLPIVQKAYECKSTFERVVVYWNINDGTFLEIPPTPPFFLQFLHKDSVIAPDQVAYIDRIGEQLDEAWEVYNKMGFSFPAEKLNVFVHEVPGPRALVLPGVLAGTAESQPWIQFDRGRARSEYLPRHEMFHVAQFQFLGDGFDLRLFDGDVRSWMEATAEWAAHQSFGDNNPHAIPLGVAADERDYHERLRSYLGSPEGPLLEEGPALEGPGFDFLFVPSNRSYGAFILAEYLDERLRFEDDNPVTVNDERRGADAIRRTFVEIGKGPRENAAELAIRRVIDDAVGGNVGDPTLTSVLSGFAVANYLLDEPAGTERFGYRDDDAPKWGEELDNLRPAREQIALAPEVTRFGRYDDLERGGAHYVEFSADPAGLDGVITVTATAAEDVNYRALRIDDSGGFPELCPDTEPIELTPGVPEPIPIDAACSKVTLVAVYADLANERRDISWEAVFTVEANLGIDIAVDPFPAVPGEPVALTFTVSNLGPGTSIATQLDVRLPEAVVNPQLPSECTLGTELGQILCELGDIGSGDSVAIVITGDIPPDATVRNKKVSATVWSDTDPNGASAQEVLANPTPFFASISCTSTFCDSASAWGDPHFVTFDGLAYDLQTVGEFVLVQSDDGGVVVQSRHKRRGNSVSVTSAIAARVGDHRIGVYAGHRIMIDGVETPLAPGEAVDFGDGSGIVRNGDTYSIVWPGEDDQRPRVDAVVNATYLDVTPYLPVTYRGTVGGLLGNDNQNVDDEFRVRGGAVLPRPVSLATLYGVYGSSWRITDAESLFDYGPGESTASFTDLSFPNSFVTLDSLPAGDRALAESVCRAAGVAEGPLLDACTLDLAVTGDSSFVAGALNAKSPIAADSGLYFEDFEDQDATGWATTTVSETETGGRSFVGPLSGGLNSLTLANLPPHTEVTLAYDLYVLGGWDGDVDPDTFSVSIRDGETLLDTTFSNTGGTQSYPTPGSPAQADALEVDTLGSYGGGGSSVYRIERTFSHWESSLVVDFLASGIDATELWGLDNVEVQVDRLLPEVFDIGAVEAIGDGTPAAGAGNLEQPRAADHYRFEVTETDQGLYVDPSTCNAAIRFIIRGADGTIADDWTCGNRLDHQTDLAPGSYTLEVTHPTFALTYALTTYVVPEDVTATATIGADPVTVDITTPGQAALFTFEGAIGDRVAVTIATPFGVFCQADVTTPSGDTWAKSRGCETFFDGQLLTEDGTFTISVDPTFSETGSATVTVFDVPDDVVAVVIPGGGPVELDLTAPGQDAVVTFEGTAGDRVSMDITHPFSFCGVEVMATAPSGAEVWPSQCGPFYDTMVLAETGTHTIAMDPDNTFVPTGTITLTLYAVPDDAEVVVSADSVPVTVDVTVPGQNGLVTFDAIAGDRVSLQLDLTFFCTVQPVVMTPTGDTLWTATFCSDFMDAKLLPETGTYTLLIDPDRAEIGTATVALHTVPDDVLVAAAIGGGSVTVDVGTPGQGALVTFDAVIGDRVSIELSSDLECDVTVTAPSAATVWGQTRCSPSFGTFFDTVALDEDGTYALRIDPRGPAAGEYIVTVHAVPEDVAVPIEAGGAPVTFDITVPGQNALLSFDALTGDLVSFQVDSPECPGAELLTPSGATINPPSGFCQLYDAVDLPEDGTYGIAVDPGRANVGSITVTLYSVPDDAAAVVVAGGDPANLSIAVLGQKGTVSFEGVAGEQVQLDFTFSLSPCGVRTLLLDPSGSVLVGSWCPPSLGPTVLPQTGTYTVTFDPFNVPDDGEIPGDADEYGQTGAITVSQVAVPD